MGSDSLTWTVYFSVGNKKRNVFNDLHGDYVFLAESKSKIFRVKPIFSEKFLIVLHKYGMIIKRRF